VRAVPSVLTNGVETYYERRGRNRRSRTLEALTVAGLVDRRSDEADPIAVYYDLTDEPLPGDT
jgi:hypothetical protein